MTSVPPLRARVSGAPALPPATARRLEHQIDRVFRQTYGARTGLQVLVQLATQQMLLAGASVETVRETLTRCVANRPTALTDEPNGATVAPADVAALTKAMLTWVDDVDPSAFVRTRQA